MIDKNVSFETVAGSFPARFGRSHQCEVILQRSFVSGVHAVVDLRDGKLLLRDMGSRNRIRLGDKDAPLESNTEVDLASYGSTFTIGSLQLRVSVEEFAEPADAVSMAMSMVTGKPLETVCNPYAASVARGAESEALARQVEAPFAAYRAEWDGFFTSLREHVESLPPSIRRDVLAGASARFPAATREPEFQALLKENGVATGAAAPAPARDADHASHALEELRTLARWFLDLPLETAEDISGFSLRLRDTLAEFLRGVIPTRDGIRSVASSLSSGGPAAADELESARTDAEVADALLNWKNRTQPKVVVKRLLTNIHIHQVGLVSGVFEGVRVLLESLSPRRSARSSRRRSSRGWRARTREEGVGVVVRCAVASVRGEARGLCLRGGLHLPSHLRPGVRLRVSKAVRGSRGGRAAARERHRDGSSQVDSRNARNLPEPERGPDGHRRDSAHPASTKSRLSPERSSRGAWREAGRKHRGGLVLERASGSDPKLEQASPRVGDDAPATDNAAPLAVSDDPAEPTAEEQARRAKHANDLRQRLSETLAVRDEAPEPTAEEQARTEKLLRDLSERMRREREQGRVKPAASIARAVGPTAAPPRAEVDTAEPAVLVSHSVISGTPPRARVSASERELETVMSSRPFAAREEPVPVPGLERSGKRRLVLLGAVLVVLIALGVRVLKGVGGQPDVLRSATPVTTPRAAEEPHIPPLPVSSEGVAPPASASPPAPAPHDVQDPVKTATRPTSVSVTPASPSTRALATAPRGVRSPPPPPAPSEDPYRKPSLEHAE